MTTAVAIRQVVETLDDPDYRARLEQALPATVPVERFTVIARRAALSSPELAKADKGSVLLALLRCAEDGLVPDGREAALVVMGGKAAYMPMVGGLRKLAASHGFRIDSHVVYEHDYFEWELGFDPVVKHSPPPLDTDRGAPSGAYAVATDRDGNRYLEVMSRGEIEKVRASSRAGKTGPWQEWWGEMARKTVVRRLFKSLPMGLDDRELRVIDQSNHEFQLDNGARHVGALPAAVTAADVFDGSVGEPDEAGTTVDGQTGLVDAAGADIAASSTTDE